MVLAAVLALGGASLRAEESSVFEVRGVAVDVTAETADKARMLALAEGEAEAFQRILRRITLRADHRQLPKVAPGEIATFVRDFSVAEEKTSPVRYLARLDYRFKEREIRNLLIDAAIPFAETRSKPMLVLPVYQAAGTVLLWDDPNPWRNAWKVAPAADGLVPILHPVGDLTDIATIGAEQAMAGDQQRIAAVTARYGGGDALVAHAILGLSAQTGYPRLEIRLRRYGKDGGSEPEVVSFVARGGETRDALLRRSAQELIWELEDGWKQANQMQFDQRSVIAAAVPIQGLKDWIDMRKRLSGVAVVRKVDMVLLSKHKVRVNLHYIGGPGQLTLALEQADLRLTKEGEDWILVPSTGAPKGKL